MPSDGDHHNNQMSVGPDGRIYFGQGTAAFGNGLLYVAFFGHMAPKTGSAPEQYGGHRVVRIDPNTKAVETFFGEREGHGGHGHQQGQDSQGHGGQQNLVKEISSGPRRLIDVQFSADGNALYIADFGAMIMQDKPRPVPGTGIIWRVTHQDTPVNSPPANLSASQ